MFLLLGVFLIFAMAAGMVLVTLLLLIGAPIAAGMAWTADRNHAQASSLAPPPLPPLPQAPRHATSHHMVTTSIGK